MRKSSPKEHAYMTRETMAAADTAGGLNNELCWIEPQIAAHTVAETVTEVASG